MGLTVAKPWEELSIPELGVVSQFFKKLAKAYFYYIIYIKSNSDLNKNNFA
jgi:hypothetical protein